ncbi:hypothetical protein ACIBRY_35670 [Streptomyces anulatus]
MLGAKAGCDQPGDVLEADSCCGLHQGQAVVGDVIQLQADNPDIEFVVPEEGAELWAESRQ